MIDSAFYTLLPVFLILAMLVLLAALGVLFMLALAIYRDMK